MKDFDYINKSADIKRIGNDVVVFSDKKEVFRRFATEQTISIANAIYMYHRHTVKQ